MATALIKSNQKMVDHSSCTVRQCFDSSLVLSRHWPDPILARENCGQSIDLTALVWHGAAPPPDLDHLLGLDLKSKQVHRGIVYDSCSLLPSDKSLVFFEEVQPESAWWRDEGKINFEWLVCEVDGLDLVRVKHQLRSTLYGSVV
eukprot:sb/3473941/